MKHASILTLALLSSCTIVDESLYQKVDDVKETDSGTPSVEPDAGPGMEKEPDAGMHQHPEPTADASVDAATPVEGPADSCGDVNTPVLTATTGLTIDTTELFDDVRATEGCTGHAAPGNDAFLKVDVGVNEKWHFHLAAKGGGERVGNPSLYLTQACDTRQCTHVSDRCPDGGDEHFTFVASAAGTWFLGIDDRNAGGGLYQLEAIRATCGDGNPEHGEACDDGNRGSGDGCDNLCRVELAGENVKEVEPNDVPSEANVLMIASEGQRETVAVGTLASCPIEDLFAVRVKAGESVRATVLDPSASECEPSDTLPALELSLRDAAGTSLGLGKATASNACPSIDDGAGFASDLSEGLYFVSLSAPVGTEPFIYKLRVEVVPAAQ